MLYIIPTPIGNIEDITIRAIRLLKKSDLILTEDTRHSKILLNYYKVNIPIKYYHSYNEYKITPYIIKCLQSNKIISIICDAGTPCISDSGFLLIQSCISNNIRVECLPGATAFVPSLVISGIPIKEFIFIGFLPYKKNKRKKKLKELSIQQRTFVIYESKKNLLKTLIDININVNSKRRVTICRELSKKFEETIRGTLKELIKYVHTNKPKGEFVIIVEGNNGGTEQIRTAV
jgi:16S rRNA (cytidine1402-2'-O)-methyltransferase